MVLQYTCLTQWEGDEKLTAGEGPELPMDEGLALNGNQERRPVPVHSQIKDSYRPPRPWERGARVTG